MEKPVKFATTFMVRTVSIKISGLILLSVLLALSFGMSGCANQIPPTGGPRDSIPPVLVQSTPRDSMVNFSGGRITFVFDEFVELNNIIENLIVSPTLKTIPVVESKLRTVTVRIKDTLEPNTTYSLNFGNAIRDLNEGNEFKNFTYLFTTGTTFDTLRLSGKVILAESGGIDSTLIVMLHTRADDSAVVRDRPRYYTKVDRNGEFRFNNLPADTFAIYALKDEGGMRRYQSKAQLFAFSDSPVISAPLTPSVTLFAYREQTRDEESTPGTSAPSTGRQRRPSTQQDKILRVSNNLESGQLDLLGNLEIRFELPLRTFDTTKVRFTDEQFNDIPNRSFSLDTTGKIITLKHTWAGNMLYNLIVDKDFAEDTLGRKLLRGDTLTFRTKKEGDYGALKLRFLNLDMSKNPVLLFVQNDQLKYTHVFTGRDVNIRLFVPGEYDLRILYDENRNGKWDPGEFFNTRRQPEKVVPVPRKLNVKQNWDTQIDIRL